MAIKLVKNNADTIENNTNSIEAATLSPKELKAKKQAEKRLQSAVQPEKVVPNDKEELDKIPPALMQNIQTLILGIVICIACILFGMTSFGIVSFLTVIGLILIAVLGTYAIILYRTYSSGNYDYVDGVCIDAHKAGWRRQYWQIIIADNENNTYSVKTMVKRRYRILPGDKVVVYVPKGLELTENGDGIYEIKELYGFMRHR